MKLRTISVLISQYFSRLSKFEFQKYIIDFGTSILFGFNDVPLLNFCRFSQIINTPKKIETFILLYPI